ncbi:hypothetical protein QYE76_039309 [Lolium multiflorum]|jgi:hypothetical protein|uniref:CCHC-type domain-containing protein n=1 Tax=Lolium multiflorum TaxID=4521 RepID=A0AAD8TB72_LOLMU|nr:hypothetical protein QYE76_039309 [Lolium multiflorum]
MAESSPEAGASRGTDGGGETVIQGVTSKLAKLGLTTREKQILVMEDEKEDGENPVKFAVMGKVLSSKKFHIQTIDSALRPQWGNPRGLKFTAKGDNIFLASMEFDRDRKRVWEGAPWTVSKHAVVLDDFDVSMKPSEIKFKRLPMWFRCDDLPFNWMNEARGKAIANQVGEFIKLDLHDNGSRSGWGQSLRARVWIDLDEPLMRGFPIESKKRKTVEWYSIAYERLPYFCFSCGIIGHSENFCPTPAERDEGKCPYDASLRYQEPWKQESQWQQARTRDDTKKYPQGREGDSKDQHDGAGKGNGTDPDRRFDLSTSHVKEVVSKFNFRATSGTRGGGTLVYKRRETPKVPLDLAFPVIKGPNDVVMFEDDPAGQKRNAIVNSPSKVAGISVPAKRAKGTGENEEQRSDSDILAEAENQPRQDQ